MKVIDSAKLEEQLEYLSFVTLEGGWQSADIKLTELDKHNILGLARKLETTLAGDGAILISGTDSLMVFAPATPDFGKKLEAACAGLPASVLPSAIETEALKKSAVRLEKAAGPPAKPGRKSTLYKHRLARARNVMLVVDDDQLICMAMQNALQKFGECVVVQTKEGALDAYLEKSPDCVFLDLHLGGDTGIDVLDAVMKYDADAHIIMLTADSSASQAIAAKKSGAKSFVSKPIVITRLEYELFHSPTFRRYAG